MKAARTAGIRTFWMTALALAMLLLSPLKSSALPSASLVTIDTPADNSTVDGNLVVRGWALNLSAATGTGVDLIHVYAEARDGTSTFLGQAFYGLGRTDVLETYGAQFFFSGFGLTVPATRLAPGNYAIVAYARNKATGLIDATARSNVTLTGPRSRFAMAIDTPVPNQVVTSAFEIGGWAIDTASPVPPGVNQMDVCVRPNGGAGSCLFVGSGSEGWPRSDVAAVFGPQFLDAGIHFTVTGLSPGAYVMEVHLKSNWSDEIAIQEIPITVTGTALMSIDAPRPEASITASSFLVGGWSIDRSVEGTSSPGTGVDMAHVYAVPDPGSGQPAIFLGMATMGVARSDVGVTYGSRYANSGYELIVDRAAAGLTPGTYDIVVHSHSSVSGTFNSQALVRIRILP